jgi:hypothetical protein
MVILIIFVSVRAFDEAVPCDGTKTICAMNQGEM